MFNANNFRFLAMFTLLCLHRNALAQQKYVILEAEFLKNCEDKVAPILIEFKMTFDEDKKTQIINRRVDFNEYYKELESAQNLGQLDRDQRYRLEQCKLLLKKMKIEFSRIASDADYATSAGEYRKIYDQLEKEMKIVDNKYEELRVAAKTENRLNRMPPKPAPLTDDGIPGYVQDKIKKHLALMHEAERKIERFK